MLQKIATVCLSLLLAVFAALQAQGAESTAKSYLVQVPTKADVETPSREAIDGEISITAAMREMDRCEDVQIQFTLESDQHTYRTSVVITPESEDEEGFLSATARFENLLSGRYRLYIERADGAELDYILAENGSASKYTMDTDSITFYLSEQANSGSAWFILTEQAADPQDTEESV